MLINSEYEILNSSGKFVNFFGIEKLYKDVAYKVTLENDMNIVVSEDHIFLANSKNMYAKSLVPNIAYLTTECGDFYVKSVEKINGCEFYDIVDSENCEYYANGFLNHNCSFLGSGDNFIAEEYLLRIQEHEVKVPIRQEYMDFNMWIWEDPIVGEDYIMAIDASPGHGEDNSTINILKNTETIEEKIITKNEKVKKIKIKRHRLLQVAEYYGRVVPQVLAEIAYQFGRKYNNAYTVVDITGGYGVQTIEKLLEFGYEHIHYAEVTHKPSRDRLQGYIKKGQKTMPDGQVINVDLIPGFFIGNNRASVLLELQRAIHLEDIIVQSVRLLEELKTFVTVPGNRVADHKRSFHDDSIMGLSIGLYVLNFDIARYKQNKGITEKMINAILTVNDMNEIEKRMNSGGTKTYRPMLYLH
jgi:predicted hydrocarbon binding protein